MNNDFNKGVITGFLLGISICTICTIIFNKSAISPKHKIYDEAMHRGYGQWIYSTNLPPPAFDPIKFEWNNN